MYLKIILLACNQMQYVIYMFKEVIFKWKRKACLC